MATRYGTAGESTGSRYGSSGSSSGSRYGSSSKTTAKKDSGPSVGGLFDNLKDDAVDFVYGFVPGAVETVKHPIKAGKNIAGGYAYTYGPALRGDWGKTGQNLYDHPFGPIADLLTLASAGAGAAVKAGLAPATAGRSIRLATAGSKVVEKGVSARPLRGYTQIGIDAALKAGTKPDWKVIGERARAGKVETRQASKAARANEQHKFAFDRAMNRLGSDQEKLAVYFLAQLPNPEDLARQTAHLEKVGDAAEVALMKDPKFLAMYNNPSAFPKVQAALKAIDDLGKAKQKILGTTLTPKAALERRFLHTRLARGARFGYDPEVLKKLGVDPEVLNAADAAANEGRLAPGVVVHAADQDNYGRVVSVEGDTATVHFVSPMGGEATVALPVDFLTPTSSGNLRYIKNADGDVVRLTNVPKTLQGGPSIDEIRAELAAKGRPEPLYLPDVMREKNVSLGAMNAGGTGLPRSPIKQNQGVLFELNKLIKDPSVAGPAFLSAVKYAHHVDLYNRLVEGAKVLPYNNALPKGYRFLRLPVRPIEAVIDGRRQIIGKTPQKIGYVQKSLDGYEEWLDNLRSGKIKPDENPPSGDPFTTGAVTPSEASEAFVENGFLIVPESYAKAMAGEFTRSNGFLYWLNRKPMRVWRALVLNLRPAWLVNNILGNTFMYLMYNASPDGVKNLAASFKRMASPAEAKQFDALMYRHFGNQLNATFIGTQRPSNLITKGVGASTKRRVAAGTERVLGSLADVDKAYESALRKAAVRTALKKNPALKAAVQNMRSETRDFYAAASKALDENPVLVQQIEDRVDAALGNFTSLGKFEKEALRSIFPFYAWFRAITEVAVKLPLEQPAKLALFSRLGAIGAEQSLADLGVSADEVPGWARGLISLGPMAGGRMPALNTANAMPFGTVTQMGAFAEALAAGHPGAVGQTLPGANPLAMAVLAMLSGKNPQTGAPLPDTLGGGGVVAAAQSVGEGLPQYKLLQTVLGNNYKGKPGKPTLYAHSGTADLLRYLGLPKADVSPLALRRMQEKLSKQPR